MPPLGRRRRAPAAEEASEDEAPPTQRRRISPESDVDEDEDATNTEDLHLQQMAKKLVRMALACEYARIPIRRADISAKVLGTQSRQFKNVFAEAQLQLREVFGMEMTELPAREVASIQQRRQAAQRTTKPNPSAAQWVLTSTLPEKYRSYDVIHPAKVPTFIEESSYIGLYTFVITCIMLAGGSLPEAKLDRYLKRTNADQTTPLGPTEKLLARMKKDGYIFEIKDTTSGEEIKEWIVAPRGKVEVGEEGAAGLVKSVYGNNPPQDLDRRLSRSLQLNQTRQAGQMPPPTEPGPGRGRRAREQQEQQSDEE